MKKPPIVLDPATVALVLVDLQNGVVGMPLEPMSGKQVVASAGILADHCRALGAPVVVVNVAYAANGHQAPPVDAPLPPLPDVMPEGWDQIADDLGTQDTDIRVTKTGWGAFTSTDLDARLRAKGVATVVLAGVATNFGVEETAREAVRLGYAVVLASDAMSSVSAQHHDFAVRNILPVIGRVRTVAELVGS